MNIGDTVKVKTNNLASGGLVGIIVHDYDDSSGHVRVRLGNGNTIGVSKTELVCVPAATKSAW